MPKKKKGFGEEKINHIGKKHYCDEWVLSLTNVKTEMGFCVPIRQRELDAMVEAFPFINHREGTYCDLKNNTSYDYQAGQDIMRRGEN
mgnify:FL=1